MIQAWEGGLETGVCYFLGFVYTKVKIIHNRVYSFTKISEELDNTLFSRDHVMCWGKLKMLESAISPR